MKFDARILIAVGSLLYGCQSQTHDKIAVESNDLGITELEVLHESVMDERLLTVRGLDHDGAVIASVVLRTGTVMYGADMPVAPHAGTDLTITVGDVITSFVSPDRVPHEITTMLSPSTATFVGLHAVATEVDREAGIRFAPPRNLTELAYSSQACDGSRFPTTKGAISSCCEDSTNTWHVSASNQIVNRLTAAPCRDSGGATGCTSNCFYGPCGAAVVSLKGTSGGHVFHPTSQPSVCGWDDAAAGGLGTDYNPEHYTSQSLFAGATPACTCTACGSDGTPVCSSGYTYVKASNTGSPDFFGHAIAMSSDGATVIVGAPDEDSNATGINGNQSDNSKTDSGAAYVFSRSGTVWTQQAYIKASNTDAGDEFGFSVAISDDGNTVAVGARWECSSASGINGTQSDNTSCNAGAVYVYTRSGTTWSQQAYVKSPVSGYRDDKFGFSVALSSNGNTLAVGAPYEDSDATGINGAQNSNSPNSGAAYVFTRSGTTWSQQAYVKASNTGSNDHFGHGLALSDDGNTLAVNAINEDSSATGINGNQSDNSATDSGAVYVFTRSGSTWSQQAYVKASNTDAGDQFGGGWDELIGAGVSLSGDGNTLAVGAKDEDSDATGVNGNQSDNSISGAGAAYVFFRSGTTWSQQAYLKAPASLTSDDKFGSSIALSGDGNMVFVGADLQDGGASGINGSLSDLTGWDTGAVYRYSRAGTTWVWDRYIKANTVLPGIGRFGTCVSANSDGSYIAVGAREDQSNATGINGNASDSSLDEAGAAWFIQ